MFLGPGHKLVLFTEDGRALFGWRRARFRKDNQVGIECTIFRNEGAELSSDLIREADVLAWERWPGQRLFTFVDPNEVKGPNPGYCFLCAGWTRVHGYRTRAGAMLFQHHPAGGF